MSLISIKDISTISTPPQDRLPIKSIVGEFDENLVKNALLKEITIGGQAFVIHNRVESIYQREKFYSKLLPNTKIAIVHGQMNPQEIDKTFHEFKQGNIDILLSTTIVENGVDIPNANTMPSFSAG